MPPKSRRALAAGLLLHTLAVLWIWYRWGLPLRDTWVLWIDLPWSLLWVHVAGGRLLWLSLVAGGLWWALVSLALTLAIGRITASGARRGR
jgi:hypothetical protein